MQTRHDSEPQANMTTIIDSVPCRRHNADTGSACWNLTSAYGLLRAICNPRAEKAGCNGLISRESWGENSPNNIVKKGHS